jgi:hypothetical protein
MSKHELDIDNAVLEFATLPAADQRAIASLLSARDKKTLEQLQKGRLGPSTQPQSRAPSERDVLQTLSPGLQRHLKRIIEPAKAVSGPTITPAVRRLLQQMLTPTQSSARDR